MERFYRGKVVVITGASSGIGKDLALLVASWGARLALWARRKEAIEEVAAQCPDAKVVPLAHEVAHIHQSFLALVAL